MVVEGDLFAFVAEAVFVRDDDFTRGAFAEFEAFESDFFAFGPGVALVGRARGREAGDSVDC